MTEHSTADSGAFTLQDSARRLGNYRWFELRMFEVVGSWTATVPVLAAKALFGATAPHFAWHGELLGDRLPELRDMTPQNLTVPANEQLVTFVDALATPATPATDAAIEQLVGLYRVVLPHLIATYSHHLDRCTPLADATVIRWLGIIVDDHVADWRRGNLLLQTLLHGDSDSDSDSAVRRAAMQHERLERLLIASSGVAGTGTLPRPDRESHP